MCKILTEVYILIIFFIFFVNNVKTSEGRTDCSGTIVTGVTLEFKDNLYNNIIQLISAAGRSSTGDSIGIIADPFYYPYIVMLGSGLVGEWGTAAATALGMHSSFDMMNRLANMTATKGMPVQFNDLQVAWSHYISDKKFMLLADLYIDCIDVTAGVYDASGWTGEVVATSKFSYRPLMPWEANLVAESYCYNKINITRSYLLPGCSPGTYRAKCTNETICYNGLYKDAVIASLKFSVISTAISTPIIALRIAVDPWYQTVKASITNAAIEFLYAVMWQAVGTGYAR